MADIQINSSISQAAFTVPDFSVSRADQGDRGTCVAFSVISLLEYGYGIKPGTLSPQYLYACCKVEDEDNPGTTIDRAFECVKKHGVCKYDVWPYNTQEIDSEAQIDRKRIAEIPTTYFKDLDFHKLFSAKNVEEYKSLLCGASGYRPMPVVVGVRIFPAAMTSSNGWLSLPLPGETSSENHAMLIYGWQDTPGINSDNQNLRGYFIAQNSWGTGKIKIPYEYIAKYALDAGTIIRPSMEYEIRKIIESQNNCDPSHLYLDDLLDISLGEKDTSEITEKTPADLIKALSAPQKDFKRLINNEDIGTTSPEDDFFGTQFANMNESGYSYPGIKLPFFFSFINRKVPNPTEKSVSDETNDFKLTEARNTDLVGTVKVFKIKINSRYRYRLVSAFLYHSGGGAITSKDLNILRKYIDNRFEPAAKISGSPTLHYFYTIATIGKFDKTCASSTYPTVFLCERISPGVWNFQMPNAKCGRTTKEFFRHILPGNALAYVGKIKQEIRFWNVGTYITILGIKQRLGLYDDFSDHFIEMYLDMIFLDGGFAKDQAGNIFPPNWNKPPGVKVSRKYSSTPEGVLFNFFTGGALWVLPLLAGFILKCFSNALQAGIATLCIGVVAAYGRVTCLNAYRTFKPTKDLT